MTKIKASNIENLSSAVLAGLITDESGSGAIVFNNGSALTNTTVNGLSNTSLSAGFTISGGTSSKTLTVNNSVGFSGTDGATLNIGAGGTLGPAAYGNLTGLAPLDSPSFTTQISVGATVIKPSASTFGSLTVDGVKSGVSGINFKNGVTDMGTLMAGGAAGSSGWLSSGGAWVWYANEAGAMVVTQSVTAPNFYGNATTATSLSGGMPIPALDAIGSLWVLQSMLVDVSAYVRGTNYSALSGMPAGTWRCIGPTGWNTAQTSGGNNAHAAYYNFLFMRVA